MYFTDCPLILFDITVIQALAFIRNRLIQIYQYRETYTSQIIRKEIVIYSKL